jgi:hypothetical protein
METLVIIYILIRMPHIVIFNILSLNNNKCIQILFEKMKYSLLLLKQRWYSTLKFHNAPLRFLIKAFEAFFSLSFCKRSIHLNRARDQIFFSDFIYFHWCMRCGCVSWIIHGGAAPMLNMRTFKKIFIPGNLCSLSAIHKDGNIAERWNIYILFAWKNEEAGIFLCCEHRVVPPERLLFLCAHVFQRFASESGKFALSVDALRIEIC